MPTPPPPMSCDPETAQAAAYARKLLDSLAAAISPGGATDDLDTVDFGHPARRWAETGLMALTGDGEAELCPVPLPSCADGALAAFGMLSQKPTFTGMEGGDLLTERAVLTGYTRNGATSLQGHCRILAAANGHIGLNLARKDDWFLLPAWLEAEIALDWPAVATEVATRPTAELVARGRMLGLAAVDAAVVPTDDRSWFKATAAGQRRPPVRPPLVVDLSSLWAGPLCSRLWHLAGAEVIKVESSTRPDGGRTGSPEFFRLLNRDKQQRHLDLAGPEGRRQLLALVREADIVLEASRPRALRQMGIVAEEILAAHPGKTWVSITGYGREEPAANWIAYGDDAGIAAGLSALLHRVTGRWLVCGDAIADPLAGLHAALAGWAAWRDGGGRLMDISLERVVRHCITATAPADGDYEARYRRWREYLAECRVPPAYRRTTPQ